MKKQIFPLQRKRTKLSHRIYEHLGNGYYRDMRTGKIIDKYLRQNIHNRSATKLSGTKLDFLLRHGLTPGYSVKRSKSKQRIVTKGLNYRFYDNQKKGANMDEIAMMGINSYLVISGVMAAALVIVLLLKLLEKILN